MLNLNSHHIGTVQSFDESLQTATVTVNYPKTYFQLNKNSTTGLYQPVQVIYPLIVDAPVICLGGNAAALTFPIVQGDECLILFNDRDLNNWFQGGAGAAVATPRLHSFSDAIILVGVRSLARVLQNYDPTRAVLRNGTAMVGVGTSLVKIANGSTTLKTLMGSVSGLTKVIQDLASAITPTTGLSAGALAAITAEIANLNTQIAGLLE